MVENVGIHRKDVKHKSMNQVSVTIVQYFDREHVQGCLAKNCTWDPYGVIMVKRQD